MTKFFTKWLHSSPNPYFIIDSHQHRYFSIEFYQIKSCFINLKKSMVLPWCPSLIAWIRLHCYFHLVALRTFARRISCFTLFFWFAPFLVGWRVPELSRDVYQKYTQKYTRKYTQKYTPRVQYNTKGGPRHLVLLQRCWFLGAFAYICLHVFAFACNCIMT